MSVLRVALLQMTACGNDQQQNLAKGETFCRRARAMNADIALFPEMWNIGYRFYDPAQPQARETWAAQAISADGEFVSHFRRLARELGMAIALTYLEKWEGGPRNSVSIIDRRGEIVLTYAKVHTCDFDVECALTPGDDFYVTTLNTDAGDVAIGAMICYDREFPESARVLMLKGAEIILVPNACTIDLNRMAQLRTRAFENMVGIGMTNYAAPQNNGHSTAFDAVAYDEVDGESKDLLIVEADEREGVFTADFDLDRLRAYREREAWGDAYRKPGRYGLLTSPKVRVPFHRADARR